jgi:hypothetical protein
MRGDVFGECERSVDDVLVKEVDVVAFGVCGVVVEWQISGQHCVLGGVKVSVTNQTKGQTTYQYNSTAPDINLSAGI